MILPVLDGVWRKSNGDCCEGCCIIGKKHKVNYPDVAVCTYEELSTWVELTGMGKITMMEKRLHIEFDNEDDWSLFKLKHPV